MKLKGMKKILLQALLWIITISSLGQIDTDSLQSLLKLETLSQEERVDVLNELATQTKSNNPGISFSYAQEALNISETIGYLTGTGQASVIIGEYHWLRAEYEMSLKYGLQALQALESSSNKKNIMNCHYLLGVTYNYLKDSIKGDAYINQVLALATQTDDKEMLAKSYNALGNAITTRRRDQSFGMPLYLKALSYVQDDDRIASKVFLLGNIGSAYDMAGDSVKAFDFLNKALKLARDQNNKVGEAFIHLQLGDTYANGIDYPLAEKHYILCEKLARQVGAKRILQNVYLFLGDLKSRMGKSKEAHDYQKKYAQARDSIFNAERARKIAELEAQSESSEKEKAIQLLKEEKQNQEIWRNVLLVGLFCGSIATYIIFRLQRSKNLKTKQLLKVQEMLNEKLKELDKLKTDFFANISHEFRTPLTLILAPLENEIKKKSSVEGKESLLLIRRSANRLLELVNQLLDISRLESGRMELHVRQSHIKKFLLVIAASFDSLAEHKQIEFVKKINLGEDQYWYDQDKVEKIIANLLSNAFKYTPSGGTVTFIADSNDGHSIYFTVADTGPGIPEDEQAQIFTAFYQTKQSALSHHQGSGLGLSLVKELVRLYSGSISLQSVPGAGTSFHVIIPIEKTAFRTDQIFEESPEVFLLNSELISYTSENQKLIKQNGPVQNGKDAILVVEDNADMREFISATLQNNDFAVFTAQDGKEGLHMALKYVPSLVLSDLMMPVMNGIELTERVKNDERTSHIPVILLTAKNEMQSKIEGLTTGADDYLTKPFSPAELLARINNLIKLRKKLAEKFRERIIVPATSSNQISLDDKFLYRVRAVVESNLPDYTFTVEKMAEEMNLSRTQLLRKLKALTGISPNDFIKDMRLKRAADMIQQRVDTITQIGYAVGFNDQSYFTKCFKKQFGLTPTDYSIQFQRKGDYLVSS